VDGRGGSWGHGRKPKRKVTRWQSHGGWVHNSRRAGKTVRQDKTENVEPEGKKLLFRGEHQPRPSPAKNGGFLPNQRRILTLKKIREGGAADLRNGKTAESGAKKNWDLEWTQLKGGIQASSWCRGTCFKKKGGRREGERGKRESHGSKATSRLWMGRGGKEIRRKIQEDHENTLVKSRCSSLGRTLCDHALKK